MGIRGMFRWDLPKLVMRAAGDQSNTSYGNLQLCARLEDGIEGVNHAVAQRESKGQRGGGETKNWDRRMRIRRPKNRQGKD